MWAPGAWPAFVDHLCLFKKNLNGISEGSYESTRFLRDTKRLKNQRCLQKTKNVVEMENQFGVEDLKAQQNQTACWDGVRNYQARNFMRDMKLEQLAFFYHSNCKEPGIAALIKIVKESYVDHTQFDKKDPHYDPRSSKQNPKWFMVDVQFVRMMKRYISLAELKRYHQEHKTKDGPLKNMALFTRARLSVQPVTKEEFDFVLSLEDQKPV
ncbi:thymocyte nuclear protein 1 isoform X5 [Stegostoma tigrinum]|uniref:thymocyte nuclear protein 1 isoform X5 n=1 Tax=Stegostoma tigrinum TaxID=3053191 RepID=UPI0028701CAA|nr:thymocyte nuclear protein 1 isoform X5 [Stegostoma tigrinum]